MPICVETNEHVSFFIFRLCFFFCVFIECVLIVLFDVMALILRFLHKIY